MSKCPLCGKNNFYQTDMAYEGRDMNDVQCLDCNWTGKIWETYKNDPDTCPLCKREMPGLMERHHLKTRRTDKKEIGLVCRECHKTIHSLFSNTDLRNPVLELDTLEGLQANERMQKALKFIRKLPPGNFLTTRESNYRKRR